LIPFFDTPISIDLGRVLGKNAVGYRDGSPDISEMWIYIAMIRIMV
jgi:hypothetical protein